MEREAALKQQILALNQRLAAAGLAPSPALSEDDVLVEDDGTKLKVTIILREATTQTEPAYTPPPCLKTSTTRFAATSPTRPRFSHPSPKRRVPSAVP